MDFNVLKKIIDDWDPIDLLAIHSPYNEYDSETKKILYSISNNMGEDEIAKVVYDVFISAFNESIFLKNINDCIVVARKIISKY